MEEGWRAMPPGPASLVLPPRNTPGTLKQLGLVAHQTGALKSEGAINQYQGVPRETPGESRTAGRGLCPHRGPEHQQDT